MPWNRQTQVEPDVSCIHRAAEYWEKQNEKPISEDERRFWIPIVPLLATLWEAGRKASWQHANMPSTERDDMIARMVMAVWKKDHVTLDEVSSDQHCPYSCAVQEQGSEEGNG